MFPELPPPDEFRLPDALLEALLPGVFRLKDALPPDEFQLPDVFPEALLPDVFR